MANTDTKSKRTTKKDNRKHVIEMVPMDYAILAELPPEGSVVGYHILGVTAAGITEHLRKTDASVGASQVGGRLTSLKRLGMVTDVTILPVGRRGWQITTTGMKALNARSS